MQAAHRCWSPNSGPRLEESAPGALQPEVSRFEVECVKKKTAPRLDSGANMPILTPTDCELKLGI